MNLLGLEEITFLEAGLLEPELIQKRREVAARYREWTGREYPSRRCGVGARETQGSARRR